MATILTSSTIVIVCLWNKCTKAPSLDVRNRLETIHERNVDSELGLFHQHDLARSVVQEYNITIRRTEEGKVGNVAS